jgi:hypothetical protein
MSAKLEWIAITKFGSSPIGAIGFLEGKAVAIAAFYDDRDGNKDGKVDWPERIVGWISPIKLDRAVVTEVAMQARVDLTVLERDPTFPQVAADLFVNFAANLIKQGVYQVYFARGVGMAGSALATRITSNMVKQLVIRKGFEAAAKKAFEVVVS